MNNNNVTFLITEYAPDRGDGTGGQYPPTTTLYGGIYAAEYLLRMSGLPQMQFVGPYQLLNSSGIAVTNNNYPAVIAAYDRGIATNTAGLHFGFYLSAQVCGESVANWALTRSTAVYATTVGTNCPTVFTDTNFVETIPAIYAQAYQGGNGKQYVVLTNKGSNAIPVQVTQDGTTLTNHFLETFVTGSDPSVVNVNPPVSSNIVIQVNTVTNPVVIPEYSVVRLEWAVSNVPPPSLSLPFSGLNPNVGWTGLTNVIYAVQGTTNMLQQSWTTMEKITSTGTNFVFTNWNPSAQQFYRVVVP
jgi:hypothetical protein